jgi:hypothetical protein
MKLFPDGRDIVSLASTAKDVNYLNPVAGENHNERPGPPIDSQIDITNTRSKIASSCFEALLSRDSGCYTYSGCSRSSDVLKTGPENSPWQNQIQITIHPSESLHWQKLTNCFLNFTNDSPLFDVPKL